MGAAALSGCNDSGPDASSSSGARATDPRFIRPRDPEVLSRELKRAVPRAGVQNSSLRVAPTVIEVGGRQVRTWAYNDQLPGPVLRAEVGDTLAVRVTNELADDTTVHWHGLTLRNDMDGIHHRSEHAIRTGTTFPYSFILDAPGTYWYHSHVGLQADHGLYGPLIVEDRDDIGRYDSEHILMLDDWIDGYGSTPEAIFDMLHQPKARQQSSKWTGKFRSEDLGGDAGSIRYPQHLINGRSKSDRPTFSVQTGSTVRLRIINAAAETAYRFAAGDLKMTVTHADGYEVQPVEVDVVLIGPGERYDVTVTVTSGAWALIAVPAGKPGRAEAILRTRDSSLSPTATPANPTRALNSGRLLQYSDLLATPKAALAFNNPSRTEEVFLTGGNADFHWGINGEVMEDNKAVTVHEGEKLRLIVTNATSLWHPMHLHGHTFRLGTEADSPRKDTVIVKPGAQFIFDVLCDNPGQWMFHCHNAYHFQAGMGIAFDYRR